ncbi:hypothetical protein [Trichormus azollae]|uniref:hypothetical protein n=1 Tax=Trichormus azollae TaxID=1164 RepID=UPI0016514EEB|nr:hypothetical protein [Trichormus azollae]
MNNAVGPNVAVPPAAKDILVGTENIVSGSVNGCKFKLLSAAGKVTPAVTLYSSKV